MSITKAICLFLFYFLFFRFSVENINIMKNEKWEKKMKIVFCCVIKVEGKITDIYNLQISLNVIFNVVYATSSKAVRMIRD